MKLLDWAGLAVLGLAGAAILSRSASAGGSSGGGGGVNAPKTGKGQTLRLTGLQHAPFGPQGGPQALVYIPSGFDKGRPYTFVFYFHGTFNTVDGANTRNQLSTQFEAVNPQAILVLPEGVANSDQTGMGNFQKKGEAGLFVQEVAGKVGLSRPSQVIGFGHSGGYSGMADVMRSTSGAGLSQAVLFDAAYGDDLSGNYPSDQVFEAFVSDVLAGKKRRFVSFFRAGETPNKHMDAVRAVLKKKGLNPPATVKQDPKVLVPSPLPGLLFMSTALPHEMANQLFAPVLKGMFS